MPRLASTSYEMGILPIFPNANRLVVTAIFFLIALILSINKSKVVERIGEYLTPLLILTLVILIFVGIISVKGDNETVIVARPFIFSFAEGYNTLDAIASVIFAKMIYDTVKNEENPMKISIRASLILSLIHISEPTRPRLISYAVFCLKKKKRKKKRKKKKTFFFFFFNDTATTEIYTLSVVGSVRCV